MMVRDGPRNRFTPEEWICDVYSGIVMGKSAGSPPAAPDPNAVAQAQAQANVQAIDESAKVNRINQVSPFGSLTYQQTPGTPSFNQSAFDQAFSTYQNDLQKYHDNGGIDPTTGQQIAAPTPPNQAQFTSPTSTTTATTSLTPQEQQIFNQQLQLAQQLTGAAGNVANQVTDVSKTPFSLSGVTPLPTSGDLAGNLKQVQDAVYARNTQYLDPQYAQMEHDLNVSLTNQGIPQGSDAWNRAMGDFQRQKQAAYSDARDAAIQAGNSAQAQEFGIGQGTQQQEISNLLLSRQEPINELAAALQGAPALQTPNFGQPAQYQVAPADVTGAYGLSTGAQEAAYQARAQQAAAGNSATAGGIGTAVAAAAAILY